MSSQPTSLPAGKIGDLTIGKSPVNLAHIEFLTSNVERLTAEGCKLPEAAAVQLLVEQAIINKTYTVLQYTEGFEKVHFDVVVKFNFAGDPTFGILVEDNEGETAFCTSTPDGLSYYHL